MVPEIRGLHALRGLRQKLQSLDWGLKSTILAKT
jgi:hypothetical protein